MSTNSLDKVTQILQTSRDVKSFYQHFLALSASMSGAQIGVAWRGNSVPFQPICQVTVEDAEIARLSLTEQRHNELLQRSVDSRKAFIVMPETGSENHPPLLFGSIQRSDQTEVVEFILPIGQEREQHQEIVRTLDDYCAEASKFQESSTSAPSDDHTKKHEVGARSKNRPLTVESIGQYVHQIHSSVDDKKTMSTVANETRRLLDCDRVSVIVRRGGTFKVAAISGQPSVNQRSNAIKLLNRLADATLKTGQRFWYPDGGAANRLPPQIEQPLNAYLTNSATRSLVILPVYDQSSDFLEAEARSSGDQVAIQNVVAGIAIEQCVEQWKRSELVELIDVVERHASDAIRNAMTHRNLFLFPVWKLLGKSRVMTAARNLPKTLAAIAAMTLLTLALCFVPANFTLPCEGVLIPSVRSRVFSDVDGKVEQINVTHGDHVTAGQVMLKLSNEDIAIELETVNAELDRQRKRLDENKVQRAVDRDSASDRSVRDNVQSIEAMLETLNRRKEILESKAGRLNVGSPINGQVITWEVEDRLKNRPVSPGEMLLEVVSIDGDWQLELQLADRRVGHLLKAMERSKKSDDSNKGLQVSYRLEADPAETFFGTVRDVSQVSQLTAEQQQTMRIIVDVDEADSKHLKHVRTRVTAKIHCGTRSLGYVWLHDVSEFFQSKVWFRLW